jgi:hypothetical protein
MADFIAPFHAPRLSTKEFYAERDKYVAKYGYGVTVPALDDIVHIKPFKPLSADEEELWKDKKYDEIPEARRRDIQKEKARKKKRYLAMLADPSPQWATHAGAIFTSLDDIQDAVATLACIGMIAGTIAGGALPGAVLAGLGVILGASEILNLLNPMGYLRRKTGKKLSGRAFKKNLEARTSKNPFSKKAKVALAKRMKKYKPSVGNALEALQVTDNIYGVGLCLGPIVGFLQASMAGIIRTAMGQKVDLKFADLEKREHELVAIKALRAVLLFSGIRWKSDKMEEFQSIICACLAMQVLYAGLVEWNPIDHVEDIGEHLIEAPYPYDPLTIEVLQEAGVDVESTAVWPQNGKRWISIADLQASIEKQATANLRHYAEKNRHDPATFAAIEAADDFAINFLAAMEGPEQVRIDFIPTERIMIIILDNGWVYPDDVTTEQLQKFEDWCYTQDYMGTNPCGKDIWNYAKHFCGFTWVSSPDELR